MKNAYGALDRLLHRLAFAHPAIQRTLGEVENDLFRARLAGVELHRPTFVTGLPRAGTTLVLELLHATGAFASFTYRQMPLVLAPLLWDRLSARSRRAGTAVERAHGDGMTVSFDSPEAFEEVLWLAHLRQRIVGARTLEPLGAEDLGEDFPDAFRALARKVVALGTVPDTGPADARSDGDAPAPTPRYLSKNNANVARLPALAALADDAVVLCCFRHPAAHVASLDAQHRNFTTLHEGDAFARRYMAWIGHHDFGANFLPIRAGAIDGAPPVPERAFWLRYWSAVYARALQTAPAHVAFVDYDALLAGGSNGLERLAEDARLDPGAARRLVDQAPRLRAPTSAPAELDAFAPEIADEARAVHARLIERSSAARRPITDEETSPTP